MARAEQQNAEPEGEPLSVTEAAQRSSDDLRMDLTRRTGDMFVYKYYAEAIGWTLLGAFLAAAAGNAFFVAFPRKFAELVHVIWC